MPLLEVVTRLLLIVVAMLGVATIGLVGLDRFRTALHGWRPRIRAIAPYIGALLAVIILRRALQYIGPYISWLIGWNITGRIYRIEGEFVGDLQAFAHPLLTEYFVFTYIYGYAFLLIFPLVAYFALDRMDRLAELLGAYALNYGIGLVLYILFIAYGPRNLIVDSVDGLLYTAYPQSRVLTDSINQNVNVFPSLHTSLAVTVLLLAWRSRSSYPLWMPIAAVLSISVVISTMYLGIHWAVDVVGGIVLAWGSVRIAAWYVDEHGEELTVQPPSREDAPSSAS